MLYHLAGIFCREESQVNLANFLFTKLNFLIIFISLMAESIHLPNIFYQPLLIQ